MATNHEKTLIQWDLYKSYGEFNFLFEDTIQEFRMLMIALVRLSYNYFDEEDDEGEELDDEQQDRLLKILMNNMGARDVVVNCKACFVDFFSGQKKKYKNYSFNYFDDLHTLSEDGYNFSISLFNKVPELIELRNVIIHSHYSEIYSISNPEIHKGKLKGRKHKGTSLGYVNRSYTFDISYFERINEYIFDLYGYVFQLRYNLYLNDDKKNDYKKQLDNLKKMNFATDNISSNGKNNSR